MVTGMHALCRDCLAWFDRPVGIRCPKCSGPRLISHAELDRVTVAHLDCDAFYAAVEKRDNPELRDKALIVGGGRRGVVATCCYIARVAGVRSAMPMFQALRLCPEAVVVRPRMELYGEVGREIRERMRALTPLVEPLSMDEAFLDLSGTQRLLGGPPAMVMARLALEIERELGVTVSIGLSHNKYLAKIASDLDKPRGFAVIGRAETVSFLAPRSVRTIWGVGAALAKKLEADGIRTNADISRTDPQMLVARYGKMGQRLHELSIGIDNRRVSPDSFAKSISSETTFEHDIGDADRLSGHLWRLAVAASDRAKSREIGGSTVVLKLKTANFRTLTRQRRLHCPTNHAEDLYHTAEPMLIGELERGPFRLIGVGFTALSPLQPGSKAPPRLFDDGAENRARAELATDQIRRRFGNDAIIRGRALR